METLIMLVKLLCAHLCSDFILQTDRINKGKRKPGIKGIGYLGTVANIRGLNL